MKEIIEERLHLKSERGQVLFSWYSHPDFYPSIGNEELKMILDVKVEGLENDTKSIYFTDNDIDRIQDYLTEYKRKNK